MKKRFTRTLFTGFLVIFISITLFAQKKHKKEQANADTLLTEKIFSDIKFRNIGPAMMSGRVSDIAIDPENENIWYVTMGSGGVWKTENSGVTWRPVFDDQKSFSIGCVTIDPNNHFVIWVGTGENVGGRHVGFGDGIYKSEDGGKTWKNMGLKASEHISKIIVHPKNPYIIWVAAQGPLWSKGGERGLYKSEDGGKTWNKTLGDDEWVGVTDIAIDPRNPDLLYAATWQRHRTVAAYMGGGPGSGIHKSTDGGVTWKQLKKGLPASNMGKIGLAISPQKPDVLYAAIELDRRTGGVYRSGDRGESWVKQSDAVGGSTGPHYYQEIWASPHKFDRIYLADMQMQVSDDGGKTFRKMKNTFKHVDNHALAFRKNDPGYLLVGCDGGVYESFDLEQNWRFMANLPTLQFYKVAVDDAEPFYNVYGGTQDNNSLGGPSRTDNVHGISNADWFMTLFADGHQSATEPGNPNIMYAEWQQGNLVRVDRTTGEIVYIKPQSAPGEPPERFNWDSPVLVSPHNPTHLYFASQRVWYSENRGDSWTAISGDLTRNQERIKLPIMGRTQSWDSPWDLFAMSEYSTITSLAVSPLREGLIYAGTDDGLIQITSDGGSNWTRVEVGALPGCPATAFVNDIKADLYDENTVYAVLDNHKYGDFKPYLYKSTDMGKSWSPMTGDLPGRGMVWRIVQDHVAPDLFFIGMEFGIYFTIDGGKKWVQLKGGLPVISFRDLAIQKRENDLVGASFGRSFFILDDYSFLRAVSNEQLKQEATLFGSRKAWWYIPKMVIGSSEKGNQGASYYMAKNPPFGSVFTYYLKESYKTNQEIRQEKEKKLNKENLDIPFPGWDSLEFELTQLKPSVWVVVKDKDGKVVRKIAGPVTKGFHRISWDLRYPSTRVLHLTDKLPEFEKLPAGFMAAPGSYTATLYKQIDGVISQLSEPVTFEVVSLFEGYLKGATPADVAAFWRDLESFNKLFTATDLVLNNAEKRIKAMQVALAQSHSDSGDLYEQLVQLRSVLLEIETAAYGYRSKGEVGANGNPTVGDRLRVALMGTTNSTYGPTALHLENFRIAKEQFDAIRAELKILVDEKIPAMEKALEAAGAPWIEGQPLPK